MGVVLAGVSPVEWYDNSGNLVMTANVPTDAGLQVAVSEDVIRGGFSNKRISSYFFDSDLTLNVTTPTFDKKYLVHKLGSSLEAGADVFYVEEFTVATANTITVSDHTPVAPFDGDSTVYGWYKVKDSTTPYEVFTFTGSTATVSGLAQGTELCIKYAWTNPSGAHFKISSSIIPDILRCVMRIPELKGDEDVNFTNSSKVGELKVYVPKYQFDPNSEITLTSSGHATTSLSGHALENEGIGCDPSGWYARLDEEIYGMDEFDGVKAIIVEDSDLELAVAGTQTLRVYKKYSDSDGRLPKLIDNSLLTFTSVTPATATVGAHTGLVTGVANGVTSIQISVTAKPTFEASAYVTVS